MSPGREVATASHPGRVPPDGGIGRRLDGVEASLAALTEHALALVADAAAAHRRLRSFVVRVVLLGAAGTVAATAVLCLAALALRL